MMIALLSIGGIILDELATSKFSLNPTIIRVMRVLRITRGKIWHKNSHCVKLCMVAGVKMVSSGPVIEHSSKISIVKLD